MHLSAEFVEEHLLAEPLKAAPRGRGRAEEDEVGAETAEAQDAPRWHRFGTATACDSSWQEAT